MFVESYKLPLHTKFARYYDLLFEEKYQKEVEVISQVIKNYERRKTRDVLDLMCGTSSHMVLMMGKGYNVVGVDASKEMVELAREKLSKVTNKQVVIQKDVREVSFKDEFDAVYCWFNSIQYFFGDDELQKVISNVHRALRDHGLFIVDLRNGMNFLSSIKGKIPLSRRILKNNIGIVSTAKRIKFDETTRVAIIQSEYAVNDKGRNFKVEEAHSYRLMEKSEFSSLLRNKGFTVEDIFGSATEINVPFNEKCDKMIFVASKKDMYSAQSCSPLK